MKHLLAALVRRFATWVSLATEWAFDDVPALPADVCHASPCDEPSLAPTWPPAEGAPANAAEKGVSHG